MIDHSKMKVQNVDPERLKSQYDFVTEYKPNTDEVTGKYIYKLHNSTVTIYPSGTILFTGSLHKLYNSIYNPHFDTYYKSVFSYNGYNANNYTLREIEKTIDFITTFFDCNAEDLILQNLETGFNITTPFNPALFINGLLYHNGKTPNIEFQGNKKEFEHSNYSIKIYNKGQQFLLPYNILRIEIKYKKSKEFKSFGIETLSDINSNSLQNAFNAILKRLNEIIYFDCTINSNTLKGLNKNKLEQYKQLNYWNDEIDKNQRLRQKNNLQDIIDAYSENLREQIRHLLFDVFKKCILTSQYYKWHQFKECIPIHTFNIEGISPKICRLTREDILMQKPNSMNISNTGFKAMKKNNPERFNWYVKNLLTGNENKFEKDIYSKLSKQVRNKFNTLKYKQNRIYNPNTGQINLLDEFKLK